MESRPRTGLADRAPCRRHVRNAADLRRTRESREIRTGLFLHPYDRHERDRLEGGRRRRRACHARRADRNAHAARDAADPEGARPRDEPVAIDRCRVHDDRRHVHPDARRAHSAAHVRQRACAAGQGIPEAHVGLGRAEPRDDGGAKGLKIESQDRLADPRQRGRHHPPRRNGAQRHAAQSRARRGRYADGALQRVDRAVRRTDQEMARRDRRLRHSKAAGRIGARAATMFSPRRASSAISFGPEGSEARQPPSRMSARLGPSRSKATARR